MKILIIGHARHGKDTVAKMIKGNIGLHFASSSEVANDVFVFNLLKDKHGYKSKDQCFQDRVNHRAEWFDMITEYNSKDGARLAKDILKEHDIYVGMRNNTELQECKRQKLFDVIIGVYDQSKPHEPIESFDIDLFSESHFIICTSSDLAKTKKTVDFICNALILRSMENYTRQDILAWYEEGWHHDWIDDGTKWTQDKEFDCNPYPKKSIQYIAWNHGKVDRIAGDDCPSIDCQTDDERIDSILRSFGG